MIPQNLIIKIFSLLPSFNHLLVMLNTLLEILVVQLMHPIFRKSLSQILEPLQLNLLPTFIVPNLFRCDEHKVDSRNRLKEHHVKYLNAVNSNDAI